MVTLRAINGLEWALIYSDFPDNIHDTVHLSDGNSLFGEFHENCQQHVYVHRNYVLLKLKIFFVLLRIELFSRNSTNS